MTESKASPTALFWTGGWDSTFRLLSLLLIERRAVQPYYVVDRLAYRPAVPAEQEAMRRIRQALQARHPATASQLGSTIECELADIAPDDELMQHYERCLKAAFIGGQYEWLARFCRQRGIDAMELSIHRDDKARGLLAPLIDASRTKLDPRFAGDGRYELFKAFRFPLFDKTKRQMRDESRDAGFEDLMKLTLVLPPAPARAAVRYLQSVHLHDPGRLERSRAARRRVRYTLRVVPRLRHWLASRPGMYLPVRSLYRRLRGL